MSTKLVYGAAVLAVICGPALAQTMTLSKGQMLKVAPNGQITMTSAPTNPGMVRVMHRTSRVMAGGFTLWMDDQGRMRMCRGTNTTPQVDTSDTSPGRC
jgi:hypothetical protein